MKAEIVREVVSSAMRAPSYKNSQPWEVLAVSGKKLSGLSELLLALLDNDKPSSPDIPEPGFWPEENQERIRETGQLRAKAFGITAQGQDAIRNSKAANFRFYGAPLVLFFYQDESLPQWSILDMGMFIQNVILGFHEKGISTVPQAFLIDYSPEVKEFLGLEKKRLILGMSVGYPDLNDPKAGFVSPRTDLDKIFRWIG